MALSPAISNGRACCVTDLQRSAGSGAIAGRIAGRGSLKCGITWADWHETHGTYMSLVTCLADGPEDPTLALRQKAGPGSVCSRSLRRCQCPTDPAPSPRPHRERTASRDPGARSNPSRLQVTRFRRQALPVLPHTGHAPAGYRGRARTCHLISTERLGWRPGYLPVPRAPLSPPTNVDGLQCPSWCCVLWCAGDGDVPVVGGRCTARTSRVASASPRGRTPSRHPCRRQKRLQAETVVQREKLLRAADRVHR